MSNAAWLPAAYMTNLGSGCLQPSSLEGDSQSTRTLEERQEGFQPPSHQPRTFEQTAAKRLTGTTQAVLQHKPRQPATIVI